MLKFLKDHKKFIGQMVTVGLFGIVGSLLVPIVNHTIKLADRYPKLLKWFFAIVCICSLFIENCNTFAIICIGLALTNHKRSTECR